MNWLTVGFWDIADVSLRWIGRSAVWLLIKNRGTQDGGTAYALIGGALVCTVLGGVTGFGLAGHSYSAATAEGATLGGLLGACMGVFFGSFVEAVDGTIHDVLRSLNSK